jgi:hypothetical protein
LCEKFFESIFAQNTIHGDGLMIELRLLRICIATSLVLLSLNLAACCIGGGSKVRTETKNVSTTLGEELQDLKAAYDEGIITEKQYNESREKILKERTKGN